MFREHGCTLQLGVEFKDPSGSAGPQLYLFEASMEGKDLINQTEAEAPFTLVDVNHALEGNEFWRTAKEVPKPWPFGSL